MTPNFPPTSRYALTPTASLVRADGAMVTCLKRRFVPPPENLALLQWHRVVQGERLDNIAAKYLGDAWRQATSAARCPRKRTAALRDFPRTNV